MSAMRTKHSLGEEALPIEEQARRCHVMSEALAQVRLEGLEPNPVFFTYVERYSRGEITLAEALADYAERVRALTARD